MSGPVFTPPPGFTPPPSFTPPPVTPPSFTPPPITPSASAPPPSFTPPPSITPPPVTPPPVTPPPITPPPIAPGATVPPTVAAADNYVPTKIRFPKWLRVADVLLVIAVIGFSIVLHSKYNDQLDVNRQQAAAERAAQARAQALIDKNNADSAEGDPLPGKRFLMFRNSYNELMAAVVEAPDDAVITWNKGITIDKKTGDCAQFSRKKDGSWKSLGSFGHLTEYAKEIVAGNTDVVDKNGKIIFAADTCFQGHLYQLVDDSMTWSAAEAECEKNAGHLISITSAQEQNLAAKLAGELLCWTGGTRITNEESQEWHWAKTEESFSYTAWDGDVPAEGSGNCLALFSGKWMPAEESSRVCTSYLCEWELDEIVSEFEKLTGGSKKTETAVATTSPKTTTAANKNTKKKK